MVNTFYLAREPVSQPRSPWERYQAAFERSAQMLDSLRCNKQITEAMQIRNSLRRVRRLAQFLGWPPCPATDPDEVLQEPTVVAQAYLERVRWYSATTQAYRQLPGRILEGPDGSLSWCPSEHTAQAKAHVPGTVWNLGFANHSAVYLWLGYEEALTAYLNAHIDRWTRCRRKDGTLCQTKVAREPVPDSYPIPWWIWGTDAVVWSHRANLLRKEYYYLRDLQEGGVVVQPSDYYYYGQAEFQAVPSAYYHALGYIWVGALTQEQIVSLLQRPSSELNLCTYAGPVMTVRRAKHKGRRLPLLRAET